jgi:hypothetical protein
VSTNRRRGEIPFWQQNKKEEKEKFNDKLGKIGAYSATKIEEKQLNIVKQTDRESKKPITESSM